MLLLGQMVAGQVFWVWNLKTFCCHVVLDVKNLQPTNNDNNQAFSLKILRSVMNPQQIIQNRPHARIEQGFELDGGQSIK